MLGPDRLDQPGRGLGLRGVSCELRVLGDLWTGSVIFLRRGIFFCLFFCVIMGIRVFCLYACVSIFCVLLRMRFFFINSEIMYSCFGYSITVGDDIDVHLPVNYG